jgi:hypothetical protein
MRELSVIIKQKQDCKTGNKFVQLLSDVERYIRSKACIATKTQQLYPYSSHVLHYWKPPKSTEFSSPFGTPL